MDDDWEKSAAKPSEVSTAAATTAVTSATASADTAPNKWDGEDDDDIKDSWEEEDDDENNGDDEQSEEATMVEKTKPRKSLQRKLDEREKQSKDDLEAKARDRLANMTPEERLAEQQRLEKIQEEAQDASVSGMDGEIIRIDHMQATSKAELSELVEAITKKVNQFRHLDDYPVFLEELMCSISASCSSSDMQKIKRTVDTLYTEKQKFDKEKSKKGGKGKGKANLRMESDNAPIKEYGTYESYDYDDFM